MSIPWGWVWFGVGAGLIVGVLGSIIVATAVLA